MAQRIGGDGPQAFLLLLSMRCTPTVRLLIVLTFATKLSLSSLDRLPASRLLLPRSGLERSDFVPWHFSDVTAGLRSVCCWGKSGSGDCVARLPSLTRSGPQRPAILDVLSAARRMRLPARPKPPLKIERQLRPKGAGKTQCVACAARAAR